MSGNGGLHHSITQAWVRCLFCGNVNEIQRSKGKLKKSGHIKHMYCPICREIRPHEEVKVVGE